MMVYVDDFNKTGASRFGRMRMCHMIADTRKELLEMCDTIGVPRKWIQKVGTPTEHFDICMSKKKLALAAGAQELSYRQLGQKAKARDMQAYMNDTTE